MEISWFYGWSNAFCFKPCLDKVYLWPIFTPFNCSKSTWISISWLVFLSFMKTPNFLSYSTSTGDLLMLELSFNELVLLSMLLFRTCCTCLTFPQHTRSPNFPTWFWVRMFLIGNKQSYKYIGSRLHSRTLFVILLKFDKFI